MFLSRSAFAAARTAVARVPVTRRTFSVAAARYATGSQAPHQPSEGPGTKVKAFDEISSPEDLMPGGAKVGTIPTDLENATGLERLEILGKMQGIDIFDMKPLDASRVGTLSEPIVVKSFGDEQYIGCTGCPADSHVTIWLTTSRDRPIERCPECGSVYKMEYVGPADDGHGHDHGHHDVHADADGAHNYDGEPKTFADFVRPEYR